MKRVWGEKRCFWWIAWSCLIWSLSYSSGYGQDLAPTNLAPNFKDYFLKNSDKGVAQTVYQVNLNHLKPALKLFAQGYPKRTLPDLKFVLRYVPNHPQALHLMGEVAMAIDAPKLGRHYYQQALHLFPRYALTFAQFGKYLMDIGENGEAVSMLNTAIKIEPKLTLAYEWLELAYSKKGDDVKSKEMRQKVKELKQK